MRLGMIRRQSVLAWMGRTRALKTIYHYVGFDGRHPGNLPWIERHGVRKYIREVIQGLLGGVDTGTEGYSTVPSGPVYPTPPPIGLQYRGWA